MTDKIKTINRVISEAVLNELIVNFGRRTAGSAVLGGKQRRPRRRKSIATMAAAGASQIVKGLSKDNQEKIDQAKASLARRKAFYRINDVKNKARHYQI